MLGPFWAVTLNTFQESLRQPIYGVVLLLGIGLLGFNPAWCAFAFFDDNKLLASLGLSTLFMLGTILAAFTATQVLCLEIERKTVLASVSKPLPRPVFILGKFTGVAGAVGLAYLIWSVVFLLALRHGVMSAAYDDWDAPVLVFGLTALGLSFTIAVAGNYFYQWLFVPVFTYTFAVLAALAYVFVLRLDKYWAPQAFTTDLNATLFAALLLLLLNLWILCAAALAASTRLNQALTWLATGLFFMGGLVNNAWLGAQAEQHTFAGVLHRVLPNLELLYLHDAVLRESPVPLSHIGVAGAFGLSYLAALLCLAVALFQTREVG